MRKHERGVLVQITDGKVNSNIGRVAYNRLDSQFRFRTFKSALKRVLTRAEQEANVANGEGMRVG